MIGDGMSPTNAQLVGQLHHHGLTQCEVLLLGPRDDIQRLNSAVDVVVSSSYSEGLPIVLGEAMALATPVVTTDAGDSRLLVDDPDRVVPIRDPAALGAALLRVLRMDAAERRVLGDRDRTRIRERFSFDTMRSMYEDLYVRLATR